MSYGESISQQQGCGKPLAFCLLIWRPDTVHAAGSCCSRPRALLLPFPWKEIQVLLCKAALDLTSVQRGQGVVVGLAGRCAGIKGFLQ